MASRFKVQGVCMRVCVHVCTCVCVFVCVGCTFSVSGACIIGYSVFVYTARLVFMKIEPCTSNLTQAQHTYIHMYMCSCRRIDCEQIRSRINQQLIAGRFSHVDLCQLCTKQFCTQYSQFCTQLTKAFIAETLCN